ncbi:hypothetical protein QYF36_022766 [Acer negundo]|nr:hypothetical protein QYF36_022766 [Acer negundo]
MDTADIIPNENSYRINKLGSLNRSGLVEVHHPNGDPIQLVSNNRAVEINSGEASSIGREVQSGSVCSIDSAGKKDQMGNASITAEKGASTVISQVQVGLGVTGCHEQVSSKRGRSNSNTFSKHRMKTRSSKIQCSDSNQSVKPRQSTGELGEVEDKVTKTLEIGTAVGFDFIGIEEEVMEAIARREEEDAANFEALNGH